MSHVQRQFSTPSRRQFLTAGAATIIAAVPVIAFLIVERHLTDALTETDQRG